MDQRVGTSSCVMHASKLLFREDDQLVFLEQGLEAIYIYLQVLVSPGQIGYTSLCRVDWPKISFILFAF